MDIQMPGMNGVEATEEICRHWPGARILVLTGHCGVFHERQALRSGALGYLTRAAAARDLINAIRTVAAGDRSRPPDIARALASGPIDRELTAREIEVLRLVAHEGTNRRMASALGITEGAVRAHLEAILFKLRLGDKTGAVVAGIQRGIIEFRQ